MALIGRANLRTALRLPTFSSSSFASTSVIASTSKLTFRPNSTDASAPSSSSSSSSSSTASTSSEAGSPSDGSTPVRYSYFVPRVGKTLSSFPVYTDVRNGGTRIMTEVRKIQGSVSDLQTDLSLFLSETYTRQDASPFNQVNKKPLRPKPGRKLLDRTGNPTYLDPVQSAKVQSSGKLKIRGNRVNDVKAFLESRGF